MMRGIARIAGVGGRVSAAALQTRALLTGGIIAAAPVIPSKAGIEP